MQNVRTSVLLLYAYIQLVNVTRIYVFTLVKYRRNFMNIFFLQFRILYRHWTRTDISTAACVIRCTSH